MVGAKQCGVASDVRNKRQKKKTKFSLAGNFIRRTAFVAPLFGHVLLQAGKLLCYKVLAETNTLCDLDSVLRAYMLIASFYRKKKKPSLLFLVCRHHTVL